MAVLRNLLLASSQNAWLRGQATRRGFVRRAVSRFMPGETLAEAMQAAHRLEADGFGVILTHLGENVTERTEADAETLHYLDAAQQIHLAGLSSQLSVKLTQLGLDLDQAYALANTRRIAARCRELELRLWIDMEDSRYPEPTLAIYRTLKSEGFDIGVAIQAYLRRTTADLQDLVPMGAAVRMVKGAYSEPPEVAFPDKGVVDEKFFEAAALLLAEPARAAGAWLAAGTHDRSLIDRIASHARAHGLEPGAWEYAMLYGIQTREQQRLRSAGHRVTVLISYGSHWFPWYMRRLAERPANLWFVARNAFGA